MPHKEQFYKEYGLNILLPSDRPQWTLTFVDGTTFGSKQGPWSEVAKLAGLDGEFVYETNQAVDHVEIWQNPSITYRLNAPSDRDDMPFFAFQRSAVAISENQEKDIWLYSCFGYVLPTYRVILSVTPSGITSSVQSRLQTFSV